MFWLRLLPLGGHIANGANVATEKVEVGIGRLIILDNYLFPEDLTADHSFVQDMTQVLSLLQSGVRVFQHLLARSNVTKLLKKGESQSMCDFKQYLIYNFVV